LEALYIRATGKSEVRLKPDIALRRSSGQGDRRGRFRNPRSQVPNPKYEPCRLPIGAEVALGDRRWRFLKSAYLGAVVSITIYG